MCEVDRERVNFEAISVKMERERDFFGSDRKNECDVACASFPLVGVYSAYYSRKIEYL